MITFIELKNKCHSFYPAILLDRIQSISLRKNVRKFLFIFTIFLLFFIILSSSSLILSYLNSEFQIFLTENIFKIRGLFFIFLVLLLEYYLAEAFYLSFYFKNNSKISFELARIIESGDDLDLTKSFFDSNLGKKILERLGIDKKDFNNFLNIREKKIRDMDLSLNNSDFIYQKNDIDKILIRDYVEVLYDSDIELQNFLNSYSVDKTLILGVSDFVALNEWKIRNQQRWWSKDNLIRIPSLGRDWAFGEKYLVKKYCTSVYDHPIYNEIENRFKIYKRYVPQIENILMKSKGSNILLMVPTNNIGMYIGATFGKMINNGQIHPYFQNKQIFFLDWSVLIDSETDNKKEFFDNELKNLFIEASNAGDIILVIPYLARFFDEVRNLGSDLNILLNDFLTSNSLNIIGITDNSGYHETIELNRNFLQFFEKVKISEIDLTEGLVILSEESYEIEKHRKCFFLFQSLRTISESAEKYFSDGVYSDKIIDLLDEVTNYAIINKKRIIEPEDVLKVVAEKTGIPLGAVGEAEKDNLNNLENLLHQRVIGQELAIKKVSEIIKRARSGIQNPKRPIGSLLFLGPTGVGKTETAKALAESFFQDEDKMIRVDMSEYNSYDALPKLIGDFSAERAGLLSSQITDKQHGVILLDEFEKADKRVLDLFLQILDEGQFKDGRGQLINVRNFIIIATSNAGSDLIFKNSEQDFNQDLTNKIVESVIEQGIFKPELVNRFDGTVLFHTLTKEQLALIAEMMIKKLEQRLFQNGIKIVINQDLINYLVQIGLSPKFGARELNRAIQNDLESQIADALIVGNIKRGQSVEFKINQNKLEIIK
jgi:ATP-dependent Clp protease ATP-binding subunit ClpC